MNELKSVLKNTLEEQGTLNQIRAMIRKSIFEAVEAENTEKPKLSSENLIINELIREYLTFNNYHHSESVLVSETGQPQDRPFDREFLCKELNIVEDPESRKIPLIYSILFGLKKEYFEPKEIEEQRTVYKTNAFSSKDDPKPIEFNT